jgi:hypothetical protein
MTTIKQALRLALNACFVVIAFAMIEPRCPPVASDSKWVIEPKSYELIAELV